MEHEIICLNYATTNNNVVDASAITFASGASRIVPIGVFITKERDVEASLPFCTSGCDKRTIVLECTVDDGAEVLVVYKAIYDMDENMWNAFTSEYKRRVG